MSNIEKIKKQENRNGLIEIEAEILDWIVSKVEKSKKEALFIKKIKIDAKANISNPVF
jgi:hypothetical protein